MKISTVVAKNLEGLCQEIRKYLAEEASKEAASDLFHLRLTLTVVFLLLWLHLGLHGHPGKCEICTIMCHCVSNVLSSISEYAKYSFKDNSCEEHKTLLNTCSCFVKFENYEWKKNHESFPHIPDEPSKPQNFCCLWYECFIAAACMKHKEIMANCLKFCTKNQNILIKQSSL